MYLPVFFGFGEGAKASMERHYKHVTDAAQCLDIKPMAMEERDPRPKWCTSVNAKLWEGTGSTPAERNAKFLEVMSYLRGLNFPEEGTSIVATIINPDDPLFMKIFIKASTEWHEQAKLRGSVRTPYGDLRLFPRHKNENKAKLDGVAGLSEQLHQVDGVGQPPPLTPSAVNAMEVSTPESQKTGTTEYETAKSTTSSMSQGMRGHEPGAKRLDKEDLKLTSAEMIAKLNVLAMKKGPPPPPPQKLAVQQQPPQQQPQQATPAAVGMLPPIPKKEKGRPRQASFKPAQPNRQHKAKKDKKSQSGESEGDRALRLQKEAWEKKQRRAAAAKAAKAGAATAATSDCESTSSWSSVMTTRSSTSKRVHSPGETTATSVKKKNERPSPAAPK